MKIEDVMALTIPFTGLYPTIDNLELDMDAIIPVIKSTLAFYSKYFPIEIHKNISVQGGYHYTFTELIDTKVPRWVSEATLLSYKSAFSSLFGISRFSGEPNEMPWRYVRPTLYLPMSGEYSVLMCCDREIDLDNNNIEVDESDEMFFNLLASKLMIAIGRTRRSIVFNNIEFVLDYADMTSEGMQRETEMKEEIIANSNFGLAWG